MRHVFFLALLTLWGCAAYWLAQTDDDLYMPFASLAIALIYFAALHGQPASMGGER
jgi:hypothetical protein